ncbi:GerAB/ArcD/ProY family transporter [Iocasia frigidifontis]|uniref:GerAB/ArcD/ProY family transporter n=1 Tax=Iocasia fonsfrigidae TaxID=2682810 RepID=A0A8A7KGB1_9FIRM|nr:GerAB/ArcD/ProY family transporter [Iocasia fonsfrigidae]
MICLLLIISTYNYSYLEWKKVKEKISTYQVFWLSLAIVLPTLVLIVPRTLAESEKLGWASAVLAGISTGVIQYILLKLSFDFSDKSVIQDCMSLFGSILGRIIILPFVLIILFDTTLILYEIVAFVTVVMPNTSPIIISIALAVLASYATCTGFESLTRISVIAMFIMISGTIIILIITTFNTNLFDFNRLKPVVFDLKTIIRGSIVSADWFRLILTLLLLFTPYLKNKNKALKASILSNLFIQLIIVILFIISIAVFEIDLTKNMDFPFYDLTKLTTTGNEIIIFVIWLIATTIKLAIFYFASVFSVAEWFKINNYKNILIPVSFFLTIISIFSFDTSIPAEIIGIYTSGNLLLLYFPTYIILILFYFILGFNK